jgi:rod shape determining protein RodA
MGFLHAVKAGGAYLWLKLELGGFVLQFQPAELCKISMTIAIAAWVAWRRNHLDKAREGLIPLSLMAIPFGAIAIQPDVGTAIILAPVPFVILFAAGLRWRIVLTTVGVGLLVMVSGLVYFMKAERVPFLRQYHHDRIHVFLEPLTQPFKLPGVEEMLYGTGAPIVEGATDVSEQRGDDWNIRQAEMALGSGRLFGKGWGKGTQSRYRFLPEHHTDFIFCSLGEQFGLAGCLLLIILYVLIGWRALRIAVLSTDPFGKFMVVGLILIFFLHIFLNIGMMVRLLPVAGLPLPLMSYGGTFLASNYLMFGLMASVGMRRRKKDFMKDHVGI